MRYACLTTKTWKLTTKTWKLTLCHFKGACVSASDFSDLPSLLQLYTRLYLSDYRKFWNPERWWVFWLIFFASNNRFNDRNIFQNGVDALSKVDDAFLTISWRFHFVCIIRLCSNFASSCHKHLLWNYKWNLRLPMSAFATTTRNTYCNINFLHGFLRPSSSMFPLLLLTV